MPTYGFDGSVDQVAMAKLAQYAGADYAVEGPASWRVSPVAGQDRTVQVADGTGYGHFILDESVPGTTIQLDPISSGTRWDLIARRRTWNPAGGGTSAFVKVTGQAAAAALPLLPSGRLSGPGQVDDQPLALAQLIAGQAGVAQIVNLRSWPTKVVTCDTLLALPDADLGTEALVGTPPVRYHRRLDQAGNLAWLSAGTSTSTVVTTGVITPDSAWALDSGFICRYIVDPTGKDVVYELELRRSGAAISVGSSGALSDVAVGQLLGPVPDPAGAAGNWGVPVYFKVIGGSSTSQYSETYAFGHLTPGGKLWIDSGIPGNYINKRSGAGEWSLHAQIRFRKA